MISKTFGVEIEKRLLYKVGNLSINLNKKEDKEHGEIWMILNDMIKKVYKFIHIKYVLI